MRVTVIEPNEILDVTPAFLEGLEGNEFPRSKHLSNCVKCLERVNNFFTLGMYDFQVMQSALKLLANGTVTFYPDGVDKVYVVTYA